MGDERSVAASYDVVVSLGVGWSFNFAVAATQIEVSSTALLRTHRTLSDQATDVVIQSSRAIAASVPGGPDSAGASAVQPLLLLPPLSCARRRRMKHAATITHWHPTFECFRRAIHRPAAVQSLTIRCCRRRLPLCREPSLATAITLRISPGVHSIAHVSTATSAPAAQQSTASQAAPSSTASDRSRTVATPSSSSSTSPPGMPHTVPPYSLPASALRSASHIFTTRQLDLYRLYALLATSAASNQLAFLAHLATHIPLGHHSPAAEAILLVQVYAGIPKTIEGMTVVRAELDRREDWLAQGGVAGRGERMREAREKSRAEVVRVMGKVGEALTARWQTYDEPDRPPPSPSLSLSPEYPSLPAVHPPPSPSASSSTSSTASPLAASFCSASTVDINSTDARVQRGLLALNSVYSTATTKLLASLHHLHPSLHHSVLQHIYGAVLCTPVLSLPAMELASVACLMGERSSRQLFSHVRGALMNGCTREMVECVMRDAERVYREARRKEEEEAWGWVEEAVTLVRRIDRKVNPTRYDAGKDEVTQHEEKQAEMQQARAGLEEERRVEVARVVSRRAQESGKGGTEALALKRSSSAPPSSAKL